LATVAVSCWVVLTITLGEVDRIDTVMAKTLIVVVPVLVESEAEVAVIVTAKSLAGGVTGAV